jgi:hypothetical protein
MKPPRRLAIKTVCAWQHHAGLGRPIFSRQYLLGLATLLLMGLSSCVSYDRTGRAVVDDWNRQFGVERPNGVGQIPWRNAGAVSVPDFVYQGIAVKDYEYKKYVDLIRRGTSWGGFGAQTAAIGLNAAGTLTSGGTTKTLSAIAGSITGASAAFSKNILFDQSITVFVGRMDALRKAKLDRIRARLAEGGYGYAEAYRDIQDYGHQGSLDAALANVANTTPVEAKTD